MKRLIFLSLVFFVALVSSAPIAPTALVFEGNSTLFYDDDGDFSLNWTAGGGDEVNYSIYVSIDGGSNWFLKADNDSLTGYSFSNSTDANYTFIVEAVNATLSRANSSSVSIEVDTTNPVVSIVYPTNTNYASSVSVLNFSYTEVNCENAWYSNDSGVSNYSVQGCGSNFTSMVSVEGSNTWIVYLNDSVGREGSASISFVVDTTDPVALASCSPSSVEEGDTVTCTCSGSDSGSGINATLTTADSTPLTSSTGTFYYNCSVTDNVGRSSTDSDSYTVSASTSSGGSSVNYLTYRPSSSEMDSGYSISLGKGYRVNFDFSGESHVFELNRILEDSVLVTVSSEPVSLDLALEEIEKVDIDEDGFYDLEIFLKSFDVNRANFVLTLINEKVVGSVEDSNVVSGEEEETSGDFVLEGSSSGDGFSFFWFLVILVLAALALGAFFAWDNFSGKKKESS